MALHLLNPATPTWSPPVLTCSALTLAGIDHYMDDGQGLPSALCQPPVNWMRKRRHQALAWMWSRIEDGLKERFFNHPQVGARLREIEVSVQRGELSPTIGAETLLFLLDNNR